MGAQCNLIQLGFILIIIPINIFGFLINYFEKHLPLYIRETFRYGKFSVRSRDGVLRLIEVPKSYFKHFYVFATAYSTLVLLVSFNVYILGGSVPRGFLQLLDLCVGNERRASVSAFSTLLAMVLLTGQCYRRLYETHCISVFSSHSYMNLSHYVVGFAHYAGAIGAIIAEAPQFAHADSKAMFNINDIRVLDIIGSVIFIWGWIHQYISAIILANLRKDHRGAVVSHEHKVPTGDLFELVSSPHLLSEIVIYFGLTLVLLGNTTWYYVFIWVLTNQVQVALLSHRWYKQNFKDYPKSRKALIPFLF